MPTVTVTFVLATYVPEKFGLFINILAIIDPILTKLLDSILAGPNFFLSKFFWTEFCLTLTFVDLLTFFYPKFFWTQNFKDLRFCGPKKVLGPKFFFDQKFSGSKFFFTLDLAQYVLDTKKFYTKIFLASHFLDLKLFCTDIFGLPFFRTWIFGPKFFFTEFFWSNFFWTNDYFEISFDVFFSLISNFFTNIFYTQFVLI